MSEEFNLDEALDRIIKDDIYGLLEAPEKPKPVTATDRLERAFLEIVEFRREHGRNPDPKTRVIAERKLGARLVGFRASEERANQVSHLDSEFGLLEPEKAPESIDDIDSALLNELLAGDADNDLAEDLFNVSALPNGGRRKKREFERASRTKCEDFASFEPLFKQKHAELRSGDAKLIRYRGVSQIKEGSFFVLGGMLLLVAEIGEKTIVNQVARDRVRYRLRVIFENGTESSMYRSSLSSALGMEEGQAVVSRDYEKQQLDVTAQDIESGHVYVLRSLSTDPQISGLRNLHKIGFSTTPVAKRIIGAESSPTYLMAPVEIVDDYRVYNVRPSQVENLLHRVFAEVRLDISQTGLDGKRYDPSEWFIVPAPVIERAINMIISGDIVDYVYDKAREDLVWVGSEE